MSSPTPHTTNQARVQTLPVDKSGNKNPSAQKIADQNKSATMLSTQAQSDTKYDPLQGPRPTQATYIEGLAAAGGDSCAIKKTVATGLLVSGILSIIYGIVV